MTELDTVFSSGIVACIVSNSYSNQIYSDVYQCAAREDLKKKLPGFGPIEYPYDTFIVNWYIKSRSSIEKIKTEKILIGVMGESHTMPNGTIKKWVISDADHMSLWNILDKYTCFKLNTNMRVSSRPCKQ
jgi:hypothetical protein